MPYRNAIVGSGGALVIEQLRSQNYITATQGWRVGKDGSAEFQDAIVRGTVAVDTISADTIQIGGEDLMTLLGESSIGKLLSARLAAQAGNIAVTATDTKVFELNCGDLPGGRTYRIVTTLLMQNAGTLALTDRLIFVYRYTTDGTSPTISSPTMDGGFNDYYANTATSWALKPEAEVDLATDAPLRIGLWVRLFSGAGTSVIYALTSGRSRPVMSLYDDGPLGTRNDVAISLTGGGIARYTKTFNALWAWGVDAAGNLINDSYGYVGNSPFGSGGLWFLVGFDSAAIVAALAGSTTPVSLTAKWKPRTRASATGLDTRIVSHNYASRAAATAAVGYPEGGWPSYASAVVNASNTVPNTLYSTSLGTGVFNQFKAATKKGIGFTTQLADSYALTTDGSGSIYGNGTSEVQLVFVYDGTS